VRIACFARAERNICDAKKVDEYVLPDTEEGEDGGGGGRDGRGRGR